MVLGMVPAMASEVTYDGTITIHSPIMGAKYTGYRIFDMTMNAAGNSVSYTINKNSKYYDAVKAYADVAANGLTLTATSADPNTFNVTASNTFNAQTFGQMLEVALKGKAATATEAAVNPTITGAVEYTPDYESGKDAVTVATADAISFSNLPLGYYLILSEYPETVSTVTIKDAEGNSYGTVTKNSTQAEKDTIVAAYVAAQTTDEKIQAYINEHNLKDSDDAGNPIAIVKDSDAWKDVKKQLIDSTTADANLKIEQGLNQIAGSEADDNVLTQRFVFIDSTTTHADIVEKNEEHKWDVPVNPEGGADLKPHGEPKGGKNIVIKEETNDSPAVYADWTEANIGDEIHYQLSINAVNFKRMSSDPSDVKQIKEYILADYQNENMEFVSSKGIRVRVVKKDAEGKLVGDPAYDQTYDGAQWAPKFFKNNGTAYNGNQEVLTTDSVGLPITWVRQTTTAPAANTANVTSTTVNKTDAKGDPVYVKEAIKTEEGQPVQATDKDGHVIDGKYVSVNGNIVDEEGYLLDSSYNKIPETVTYYYESLYPNDVTILVDYYMTLKDTAVIDGDGNINVSRYGVNYVEPTQVEYQPVKPGEADDRKPTEIKEKDDAKVYTYAVALHKVDQDKKDLDGAKFKALGLTVTEKAAGYYKVKSYDPISTTYGDEMKTDSKGLLVIEGLATSTTLTIQETEAPDGYNKLEGTVEATPEKLSETVTTSFSETYFDANGNVIDHKEGAATTTIIVTTIDNLKKIAIEIVNKAGGTLPSTGGMGTTIFYVGGSILVLAAAILLITKRRMSSND